MPTMAKYDPTDAFYTLMVWDESRSSPVAYVKLGHVAYAELLRAGHIYAVTGDECDADAYDNPRLSVEELFSHIARLL